MWLLLLVLTAPERSADDLLAALSNPSYQLRRKAVLAVEGRKEPALLNRLLEVARSDPHGNIRGYAAEVLGTFRDDRIFPLLETMSRTEEYGTRTRVYVALGKLGDPRGRRILLDGLNAGRGLRAYAAEGLGLLGDPRGFEPVAKMLLAHHETDPYMAELGPEALVRLHKRDGLAFLRRHFLVFPSDAARELARHRDEETRKLMELVLKSEQRDARLAAIRVLSAFADKRSTPALLAHLQRRPIERTPVFEALGKARDPRAAAPLIAALRKERELLPKMRLVVALGRIGDKAAIEALRPLLYDDTMLAQPGRISAVYGFPYSARVSGAAAWATLTIRDGKEPFPLADLSVFRSGKPPPHVIKHLEALRK